MNLIAAVDRHWAIGYKGKLLNSIPEDMKFFRETTTNKVLIMGRKTLESFPNGLPLKNRVNIVLSRQKDYKVRDAIVVHSVEEALAKAAGYNDEDVYVIGGASIYEQFLPYCSVAHVTKMDYVYQADAYLADLDQDPQWLYVAESEEKTYFDLEYQFVMYIRKDRLDQLKHMNL